MRTSLIYFAITVAAATILACGSGGSGTSDTQGPGAQQGSGSGQPSTVVGPKHRIVLEVTATKAKDADVTYSLTTDQSQENGAKLPWKKELTSNESLLIVSVVAQSKGTSGDIACKITVNGAVVKENKSSGEYAIVTCSNS